VTSAPRSGWATRAGTAALLVIYGLPFLWLVTTSMKTDAGGVLVNVGLSAIIILQITPQPASLIPLYRVLGAWNLLGSQLGVILADTAVLLPFCILIIRPFFIAWGEFLYAITFLADRTQYPISVLIAGQIGRYGIRWSNMMAIAVAASLPILAIYAFTHRLLRDGLALGSVR
jgi:multiple sugar transport system permease protein